MQDFYDDMKFNENTLRVIGEAMKNAKKLGLTEEDITKLSKYYELYQLQRDIELYKRLKSSGANDSLQKAYLELLSSVIESRCDELTREFGNGVEKEEKSKRSK